MSDNRKTIFQRLNTTLIGVKGNGNLETQRKIASYEAAPLRGNPNINNDVLYTFSNKDDRDRKLMQLKQEKMLAYQWQKISYDSNINNLIGLPHVKVMYRDADLMDGFPDISSALHLISEEATTLDEKGKMLHVYSKSPRVQAVLEDLFENRLDINIMLPMIARSLAKYGNEFMYLNIDAHNGIQGWKEMNVHEMARLENGQTTMYGGANVYANQLNMNPNDVKFIWEGHNDQMPFQSWQMAHFRLIKDSQYLPYGVSHLNGARRHWRMLSMMEDGMLLYRLERSIERRIFKVNVGLIDDADVPAFLQEFMNGVKRAPVTDPQTGQIDLRKNFLDVSADYVIPVRPGQDPSSIETLQSAQNSTSMDDIKYIESKILSVLRTPKVFLNYQEAQGGKAQNLSLVDIRFCRMINYIQQALLMELNKVAIIHLYLLGFTEELTNFKLSLNNPSNQIEAMALENLKLRLDIASTALAEQGCGIPLMSWRQVQREIMKKNDNEIAQILNEIRVEKAMAAEIAATTQIIKRTGVFDKADRLYGVPGAQYQQLGDDMNNPMGGPSAAGAGGFGSGLPNDMESPMFGGGDINGQEGSESLEDMGNTTTPNEGPQPLQEMYKKMNMTNYFDYYINNILTEKENEKPNVENTSTLIKESNRLVESMNESLKSITGSTTIDDDTINEDEWTDITDIDKIITD